MRLLVGFCWMVAAVFGFAIFLGVARGFTSGTPTPSAALAVAATAPTREARMELLEASTALYLARAAVPATDADIERLEREERAAARRWEAANEEVYGADWRSHQSELQGQMDAVVQRKLDHLDY